MKSRKVKAYNASKKRKVDIQLEGSDDSDVNSDSFYHDEIDDFNDEKDDELSTDDELIHKESESSEEEEVLPITDDEKEDSEDDDQVEIDDGDDDEVQEESEDDDLPNRDAWGKKKSMYFSADFVDKDRGRTYREEDAEAAKAEEDEAHIIQKSVYHHINDDTSKLITIFEESSEEDEMEKKEAQIEEDIIEKLKKQTKIFEYKDLLVSSIWKLKIMLKLHHLVQVKKLRSKQIELYVRVKKQILSLIIHNINVYYMLVSSGKCSKHHPVHQCIAHFKQLLDNLESRDQVLTPVIDQILEIQEDLDVSSDLENSNQPISQNISTSPKHTTVAKKTRNIKKTKVKHIETDAEKEVMSLIGEVKEEIRKRKFEELGEINDQQGNEDQHTNENEAVVDEKRIISYEIAKNKGLIPHRKKEYRNPRVRHRMKYRKAQIRRKGQVRNVVKEIKKYEGEPTGISTNVVKSIKFK